LVAWPVRSDWNFRAHKGDAPLFRHDKLSACPDLHATFSPAFPIT